jgi:ATP-dependent RNA helicase DeaD
MLYDNKDIEKSLIEMGFKDFTEIQERTIPLLNEGSDVIGHSQTGTGKTAAFTVPILSNIDYSDNSVQALILTPTRELCVQVKGEIEKLGKYVSKLRVVSVYGGESIQRQIQQLKKKPQVIVSTPGRLLDHIGRKTIRLNNLKYLVLDEADEMLNMGFIDDIEKIIQETPETRQTTLFSATMPKPIVKLSKNYMTNPELVSVVSSEKSNKDITQYYYQVRANTKIEAVARLLHVYQPKLSLVFCNTKRKVDEVTKELIRKGYNADKIHGDLQQTSRLDVLNKFHSGVLDILVATDVAARGLDIKNVEAVINFDVPDKPDYYVHRIGRTGRIGQKGFSFTLVSRSEVSKLNAIIKFTKSSMKKRNIPTEEKVVEVRHEKELADVTAFIQNEDSSVYTKMATTLLIDNTPEDIIASLLNKLAKKDNSNKISGDINEDYSKPSKRRVNKNTVRFHLNIGSQSGLSARKLADLVIKKTRLRNNDIDDVAIRPRFSYFSVPAKYSDRVMNDMTNFKFNGKTSSVQFANDKK